MEHPLYLNTVRKEREIVLIEKDSYWMLPSRTKRVLRIYTEDENAKNKIIEILKKMDIPYSLPVEEKLEEYQISIIEINYHRINNSPELHDKILSSEIFTNDFDVKIVYPKDQ